MVITVTKKIFFFRLKDVSLDTAAASNGLALAGGVELCECPPEYNSTSCQDPSIGFYRWYDKEVNTATILIQLVGEARPCECNNRSDTCDIETGFCLVRKLNKFVDYEFFKKIIIIIFFSLQRIVRIIPADRIANVADKVFTVILFTVLV